MRSGSLLLGVRAALRPAVGRVLAATLIATLVVPVPIAAGGAAPAVPKGGDPAAAPLPPPPGTTSLVSENRKGNWADGGSIEPSMSDNGRFIAFTSRATDLIAGGGEGPLAVYIRDRRAGKTIKVPPPGGTLPAGGTSSEPDISGDGRVVAYTYSVIPSSTFTAVVTPVPFVVAYDRTTGVSQVVSRNQKGGPTGGAREPSVSSNGRFVAYTTTYDYAFEDENEDDVMRFDRQRETTVLVSRSWGEAPIGGHARAPSISGDGGLVAFVSDGGDSVVNEDTGSGNQVYVRNLRTETTVQASRAPDGKPANGEATEPAVSGNGRFVAFTSSATNIVTTGPAGGPGVFRHQLATGRTELVTVTPDGAVSKGASGQPSITPDGSMIAFASTAGDLAPATAGVDAHLAAFVPRVPADVYLRDLDAGETILVSVTADGTSSGAGSARSFQPVVAGAGRYVAFASNSPRILDGDRNETFDVFLRDLPPVPVLTPVSLDLGAGAVGTTSAPGAATLANAGWSPLVVTGSSISGSDKKDFAVVVDGCKDRVLRRNEACSVSVVFSPTAKGTRTASLAIADNHTGSPRTVRLRGLASQAKLKLDPVIGPPGIVTVATGTGFPPGSIVSLRWSEGMTPTMADVTADEKGRFSTQVLVFHNDRTGPRELIAESATGTGFPPAKAEMLVVRPSAVPPTFSWLRITDLPIVLVIRG